jgi:hypothetical protein
LIADKITSLILNICDNEICLNFSRVLENDVA